MRNPWDAARRPRAKDSSPEVKALKRAVLHVLEDVEGRQVFWWLVTDPGRLFQSSYHDNANRAAYLEGRRAVGRELMAFLQGLSPRLYLMMMQEAVARAAELAQAREEKQQRADESEEPPPSPAE